MEREYTLYQYTRDGKNLNTPNLEIAIARRDTEIIYAIKTIDGVETVHQLEFESEN